MTLGDERMAAYDLPGAIEAYTRAIERDPRSAEAYSGRCGALREARELDRALEDCNKAILLFGGDAGYVNRGNVYDDLGEFALALADYDRAIGIDPVAAGAYRNRGVAYHRHGDNELALADYDRAIELDPSYAMAYAGRGGLHQELGDVDAALDDLERALALDPNLRWAYVTRGNAHLSRGNPTEALADYDTAIELDPGYAFAYGNRALALIETGAHSAAIADAGRAIRLRPEESLGYYGRGLARAYLGQDDLAIRDYDLAITLETDYFAAIGARARAHMRQGAAGAALADTERLVALAPDSAFPYAFRAGAKVMSGNLAGARADFDWSLAQTEDPEEIDIILELRAECQPPAQGPQRVARPESGFTLSLPATWEFADAVEMEPAYWYDAAAVGDVNAWYQERLAEGLLLEARVSPPFVPSTQWCSLFDLSGFANQTPPWKDVEDAAADYRRWYVSDSAIVSAEISLLEARSGRVSVIDSHWQDGSYVREFVYAGGEEWFLLGCMTYGRSPDDRWRQVAETLAILPGG